MQITVYLDIIFFINFIADFIVLLFTGIIMKQKLVLWRLTAGAAFGAGMLLPFILYPYLLLGKTGIIFCTGISMGAVAISFGRKNGGLIKKWFLSTTILVLLGGMMNYLRYVSGVSTMSLALWMFLFAGSGGICFCMLRFLQKMIHKRENIYFITIKHGRKETVCYVYLDTGNLLWDPLFCKPVILLSEELVRGCMTEEEIKFVEQYKRKGQIDYQSSMVLDAQKKVYFHEIAYQSVGNSSGKLLCFLAEEIDIKGLDRVLKKQPVAIGSQELFEKKSIKAYCIRSVFNTTDSGKKEYTEVVLEI